MCRVLADAISIHAPREGGDVMENMEIKTYGNFNPRPPRGGRPARASSLKPSVVFQSTPPARGATLIPPRVELLFRISIHAPREGGDLDVRALKSSIHSIFQSTPPARGATAGHQTAARTRPISIHAPREGGDYHTTLFPAMQGISIHAPREGGDS